MEPYRVSTVLRAVVFGLGLLTASAVMLCGWIEPDGFARTGLLLLGAALYTPQVRQVLHGYGVADGADIAAQRRLNLILLVGLLPLVPYAPALLLLMLACGVGSIMASRLLRCAYAPVAGLSLVWPQRNLDVLLGTALSPSCAYVVEPHGYTALVQAEEAAEKAKETAARAAAGGAQSASVYPPQAAPQSAPERGGAAA